MTPNNLLSSRLYCRLRNFTESATKVARGLYRRWGIAPRPETDFLALSIAQVLQIARGCAIIDKNKFGDWVVFPCCLVHSGSLENGGCNGNRRDFAVKHCHGGGPDGTFCAAGAVCPTGLPQNCGQTD